MWNSLSLSWSPWSHTQVFPSPVRLLVFLEKTKARTDRTDFFYTKRSERFYIAFTLSKVEFSRGRIENWLFHVLLPLGAYATLALSTYTAGSQLRDASFGFGAAALLPLLIGIHNGWHNITHLVLVCKARRTVGRWTSLSRRRL